MAAHHILDISCYDEIIYTIKYNLLRSKGTSQRPFYPSGGQPLFGKSKKTSDLGGPRFPKLKDGQALCAILL